VFINEKSAQGLQRIDFYPTIGDVGHIAFDQASADLFMSVTEVDGTHSIWRLTKKLEIKRVLVGNNKPGEVLLQFDSRGRLYVSFANPGNLWRSTDLGETWKMVVDGIDGAFWTITDDGHGTLWGALHSYNKALLYRSVDDGLSWEIETDFQKVFPEEAVTYREGDDRYKLRHLHGVSFIDGKLFVGVGDVARFTVMSADGGATWKKIWSEGFTSSAMLVNGSGLLLGPDRLQAHGVGLYDFATGKTSEVWNPKPYGYAGYTYSMLQMDGVYYAAFHNETNEVEEFIGKSGIIVSPDGQKWYPFLELDPVTHWARTDIFLAPGEKINGTVSLYGYVTLNGAVYMFEPPIGRWFELHHSFGG
jgi:hypothetical protein